MNTAWFEERGVASMAARTSAYIECRNCGKPIQRPELDSYPPSVEWVHVLSPLGPGNRYCNNRGGLAEKAPS